jgi:hypothetical protein
VQSPPYLFQHSRQSANRADDLTRACCKEVSFVVVSERLFTREISLGAVPGPSYMKSHRYAHLIVHLVLQNLMAFLYKQMLLRCQDKVVSKPDLA